MYAPYPENMMESVKKVEATRAKSRLVQTEDDINL